MPVNYTREEYNKALPDWQQCEDAVKGSPAIKARTTKYLPMPNPSDETQENKKRYEAYIERATFVNFTSQTEDGLLGMVEKKPHNIELPEFMESLKENIDGCGNTLQQSIVSTLRQLMRTGRDGLLIDIAPNNVQVANRRDTEGLMPYVTRYPATSIINWREEVIGGKKVLSLVVLKESVTKVSDDGFDMQQEDQYRVLTLLEGVYTQAIYDHHYEMVGEMVQPRKADGTSLDRIPFIFVGSEDNDTKIDKATLYDISSVNIAHYRNSADFEESSFMVGQPTLVMAGLSEAWVEKVMKGSIAIGSRGGVMLPEGGSANLLQANENQMPSAGMEMKEKQMVKLGALIIQDANGNETAEAAKIRHGGQNSKLARLVKNTESAYYDALVMCSWFMPGELNEEELTLELNTVFYDATIDPQIIMAEIQMLDRGLIAVSDFRRNARKRGLIEEGREDEDINLENGEADPLS